MTDENVRRTTLILLGSRASAGTVCPSEVARALFATVENDGAASDWRDAMPMVHAAIDRLLTERQVRLSWKGKDLPARIGPYRIGRGARYQQPE